MKKLILISTAICLLLLTPFSYGSNSIYVGKNHTIDGHILIGGSGDEVSSHWLELIKEKNYDDNAFISVGVTDKAFIPGELSQIPQSKKTFRYLTMNYSEYEGFPAPLTNGGLNEFNVAARDVWSPSREELLKMTPNPQSGPQYSDLSRIVMERAKTAKEAVQLIGQLIDRYGYSTYGGNSHMFADENEGWVLINFAGGQGLWVAERLGDNDIRMSYPGYINEIPLNYEENPNFMGSKNFVSFAISQGWYDPQKDDAFNVMKVYGTNEERIPRSAIEQEIKDASPINLEYMMKKVRDLRVAKDSTGYGQVAELKNYPYSDLNLLWIAPTSSVTAPFIPYRIGINSVAPEFGKHRYLTKGEATRFITKDWQIQEATDFAGQTFKRLMYFTCDHPQKFLPEVTETLEAFEFRLIEEQKQIEVIALALYESNRGKLARNYLTKYSATKGKEALQIGNALLSSIYIRTKEIFGLRKPKTDVMSQLSYDRIDCLPK